MIECKVLRKARWDRVTRAIGVSSPSTAAEDRYTAT